MLSFFTSDPAVCIEPGGTARTAPKPLALLPGSFNPLHHGHTTLARVAAARLGTAVHFELSVVNADKPQLPRAEVERRVAQFAAVGPVWLTRAATFVQKADLFPGAAFVLGWDTAVRVIDPKYYGGEHGRDAALRRLTACGSRLVVGGRIDTTGTFRVWDGGLVDEFAALFVPLTEADFRADVSSTDLRRPHNTPAG
ncbi:nucleotidyl transferase family protein [Frigoriglobus tundricola]|uniref:Nicotinic acid mononucleotide adenylyltransferase n=1 Tax=Frigoriglobus tundricola TaxID=2774151 RepID=A0A6M5YQ96_9BACT|nr:hypothetical protein [Frigoriglobus tundricola]QJW96217.1 Nicotinic acid mononucleotide adenylyltransferase [Frigoriglobus tundricola]